METLKTVLFYPALFVIFACALVITPVQSSTEQTFTGIPFVAMAKPHLQVPLRIERYLAEHRNFALINTGNDQRQLAIDFPNVNFVIPIMGWTQDPMAIYQNYVDAGALVNENVHYYNCGITTGGWETSYDVVFDEPGSHGAIPIYLRPYNYGQAARHYLDVMTYMPGLKPIATHPFNIVRDYRDEDNKIILPKIIASVYAVHISFLHQIEERGGVPEDSVLWAYIIDQDIRDRTEDELREIGDLLRSYNCKGLLLNDDDDLLLLWYRVGLNYRLTAKTEALLEGLRE